MLSKYLEPQAVVNEQYPQNDESKKKRKISSNSLGNHLSLPQQQWRRREKASNDSIVLKKAKKETTQTDFFRIITETKSCCSNASSSDGCILRNFCIPASSTVNLNEAQRFFYYCQELIKLRTKEEKNQIVLELFRNSIKSHVFTSGNEKKKLVMEYEIPFDGQKIQLCRVSFAKLLDISSYQLESFSKQIRDGESGFINPVKIRSYTDKTILDFTFRETEAIFSDEVQGFQEHLKESKLTTTRLIFCVWFFAVIRAKSSIFHVLLLTISLVIATLTIYR
jgi:hypothetical protein